MFCHEAEQMADKLVSLSGGTGTKVSEGSGWKTPGVQWHMIMGQRHAFEGFPEKDPKLEDARPAAISELNAVLTDWLRATWS